MMARSLMWTLVFVAALVVLVVVLLASPVQFRPPGTGAMTAGAPGPGPAQLPPPPPELAAGLGNFTVVAPPMPAPSIEFADASGHELGLDKFRGKVILVNLWATWCAPCRAEMPSLDRLEAAEGGANFQVVAIAEDAGGMAKVKSFLAAVHASHITPYVDTSLEAAHAFGAIGLPTSLLIDREGRVIGRLVGAAAWDEPAARALIEKAEKIPAAG